LARGKEGRRGPGHQHTESGQPHLTGLIPDLWQRRLGARLLSEVQQSASRVSGGVVERCELGRSQPPIRGIQVRKVAREQPAFPLLQLWRGRPARAVFFERSGASAPAGDFRHLVRGVSFNSTEPRSASLARTSEAVRHRRFVHGC